MKFATGMNPWSHGGPRTLTRIDGAALLFTYPRSKAALADGLTFRIEDSPDMTAGSWQMPDAIPAAVEDLGPLQQVTVAVPIQTNQPLFLRLRVQSP